MLTPSKIKNHHFETSGKNSYRAQSVDEFFDIVADSYDQMFKENGELVKKISQLAAKIEEYRNDEDNIRAALITAQRAADQIMKEAKANKEALINETAERLKKQEESTDAECEKMIADAQNKADAIIAAAATRAQEMLYTATAESKEQEVVARDRMIKAQAGLDLIEKEADKFKSDLLSLYAQHIELVNKIPEIVEEQAEEEKDKEEEKEPEEEVIEEVAEATDESEVIEEAEEIAEPEEEEIEEAEEEADEPEEVIEETPEEEEEPEEEVIEEVLEEIFEDEEEEEYIPEYVPEDSAEEEAQEDEDNFDFSKFLDKIDDEDEEDEVEEENFNAVIAAMKQKNGESVSTDEEGGFKFDMGAIKFGTLDDSDDELYDEDDDEFDDLDDDDDDDDNGGGLSSKFLGFFKR